MKRIALSEACCTANPSKNRSSLHSATILNHSTPSSQANSLLLLGRGPGKAVLRTLKINRKLMKIATTIIFSFW